MGHVENAGTLFVPSSLLVSSVPRSQYLESHQPTSVVVPWADWAEKVSWVDTSNLAIHHEHLVFGQRMVALVRDQAEPGQSNAIMLDFDQRRLKSRNMLNVTAAGRVRSPGGRTMDSTYFPQIGEEVFCTGANRVSMKYVEGNLPLDQAVSLPDQVTVDDEHGECMH